MNARGSREEVWEGKARRTAGGLCKDDLVKNMAGKIVSKRQSETAKARYPALKQKLLCRTQQCHDCDCEKVGGGDTAQG